MDKFSRKDVKRVDKLVSTNRTIAYGVTASEAGELLGVSKWTARRLLVKLAGSGYADMAEIPYRDNVSRHVYYIKRWLWHTDIGGRTQ